MLVCKVIEVWQDFLSEYVDRKFTYICYRRLIRHEWIYYGSKNCVIYNSYKIAVFTYHSRTLNVVWMEREFDAYKLPRCMCPSKYNRFWDTTRYLWKYRHFIIPLAFDAHVRGVPVGISAPPLVWENYNGVATRRWKNFEDIFIRFGATPERDRQTDRRTDGHRVTAIAALCIASHG